VTYREFAQSHLADILSDLRAFVEAESPTVDKAGCDRAAANLADRFQQYTNATIHWHRQIEFGDHFEARIGGGPRQILLLGHTDTVWPIGTVARLPCRLDGDFITGPGCYDMKYGSIQALWALRALREGHAGEGKTFIFIGNSDEEVGSPTSRHVIEAVARRSECVLVLEPSLAPNGAVKLWRKGSGRYRLEVWGLASHSGADPDKGRSAIRELARQIVDLDGIVDAERGTTVNVGTVRGGTRANVVPASAECEIDIRFRTMEEAHRAEGRILRRPTFIEGTTVRVEGAINAPPMEETVASRRLYELAKRLAAEEGFELPAGGTGGGSDGNRTAALGIPTLDGLGAVGDGAHADHERVRVSTIAARVAWFARLLAAV
jgi:glutamate carboxypeptidase